jgi:SAM-dependent methyltransferase
VARQENLLSLNAVELKEQPTTRKKLSKEDRDKWDARYRAGAYEARSHASQLLVEWAPAVRADDRIRACDFACGRGRNCNYLAQRGYQVEGYDVSAVALELAANSSAEAIRWIQRDLLVDGLPETAQFDLIVVFRFVDLEGLVGLTQRLTPGGMLIIENHLQWPSSEPDLSGPGSDRFRVAAGALVNATGGMTVLHEFEGLTEDPDGSKVALAQLVATKPMQLD